MISTLKFMTGIVVTGSSEDVSVSLFNDSLSPASGRATIWIGKDNNFSQIGDAFGQASIDPGQRATSVVKIVPNVEGITPALRPDGAGVTIPRNSMYTVQVRDEGGTVIYGQNLVYVYSANCHRVQFKLNESGKLVGSLDLQRTNLEEDPAPVGSAVVEGADGGYVGPDGILYFPDANGNPVKGDLALSLYRPLMATSGTFTLPELKPYQTVRSSIPLLPVGNYPNIRKGILSIRVRVNTPGNILIPEGTSTFLTVS